LFHRISPNSIVIELDGITEGAAATVLTAKKYIDNSDPIMIANSDQYVDIDIDQYLANAMDNDLDGLIMTMTATDPKWSFVGMSNEGLVETVVEKQVISHEATVGIYNFRTGADFVRAADAMIAADLRSNGEFYVAPAYNLLILEGYRVGIVNVGSEGDGMYGLGTPADLDFFLDHKVSRRLKQRFQ